MQQADSLLRLRQRAVKISADSIATIDAWRKLGLAYSWAWVPTEAMAVVVGQIIFYISTQSVSYVPSLRSCSGDYARATGSILATVCASCRHPPQLLLHPPWSFMPRALTAGADVAEHPPRMHH